MAKKRTKSTEKRKSSSRSKDEFANKNISRGTSTMKIVVPVTSAYGREFVETKPGTANENIKSSSEKGKREE